MEVVKGQRRIKQKTYLCGCMAEKCNVNTYETWRTVSAFRQGRARLWTLSAGGLCVIRGESWLATLPLTACKATADWSNGFLSNYLCSALPGALHRSKTTRKETTRPQLFKNAHWNGHLWNKTDQETWNTIYYPASVEDMACNFHGRHVELYVFG